MKIVRVLVLFLALLSIAATANAGVEWTRHVSGNSWSSVTPAGAPGVYAQGAVAATAFHAKHVARMVARHPGGHFDKASYEYVSDPSTGALIGGEQISARGSTACWYLATFNRSNQIIAASCAVKGGMAASLRAIAAAHPGW